MASDEAGKLREALYELLNGELPEQPFEKIRKQVRDVVSEIDEWLTYSAQENLASNLSFFVQDIAEKSVTALLAGDDALMRSYLKCQDGGWNGRERDHSVIYGKLFEPDCFVLRKKIVDAHADMLKTERISDLESQVASLVEKTNRQRNEIERLRDELRNYKPF
jgi:hypothetical protein